MHMAAERIVKHLASLGSFSLRFSALFLRLMRMTTPVLSDYLSMNSSTGLATEEDPFLSDDRLLVVARF